MTSIIGISGLPACGKSTIVRAFMGVTDDWEIRKPIKLVDSLYSPKLDLYVLGKYEVGDKFPGTDRASMAVQPMAEQLVNDTTSSILFEGDRLCTASFLEHCANWADQDDANRTFNLLIVEADKETIKQRHKDREDTQNETWLRGRETKIDNLRSSLVLSYFVTVMKNNNADDMMKIVSVLKKWLDVDG
jgi:hypothetical protein